MLSVSIVLILIILLKTKNSSKLMSMPIRIKLSGRVMCVGVHDQAILASFDYFGLFCCYSKRRLQHKVKIISKPLLID